MRIGSANVVWFGAAALALFSFAPGPAAARPAVAVAEGPMPDRASEKPPSPLVERPLPEGASLEVHEWGVVLVDMATGKRTGLDADLPAWICRPHPAPRPIPGGMRKKKPILYFYPKGIEAASVRVKIDSGNLLCWWPSAERARDGADGVLTWPEVRFLPGAVGGLSAVKEGHWIGRARDVDAQGVEIKNQAGESMFERFLFYEGERRRHQPLVLGGTPEAVTVRNAGAEPVHDLLAIRREGARIWCGACPRLEAGGETVFSLKDRPAPPGAAEMRADPLNAARNQCRLSLVQAGLFEKEAAGLVGIWDGDFFEREGITLLYRWDQSVYDRLLPLEIQPKPTKTVRVMIEALVNVDLDLAKTVGERVRDLGSPEFAKREEASRKLIGIGAKGAAYLEPYRSDADPEVRARVEAALAESAKLQ